MTQFDKLIKAFMRELTDIKAAPTRSPSEMVLKQRTITIYPVVNGYISSNKYYTLPSKAGVAVITLDQPGFAVATITDDLGQRKCLQRFRSDANGNREVVAWIQDGSPADAGELSGSGSKTIPLTIQVTATCDFTLTQYQTEDWYS